MESRFRHQLLLHNDETRFGDTLSGVKDAENIAKIILEYEERIRHLYGELRKPSGWGRSKHYKMDEISNTSLCIKGNVETSFLNRLRLNRTKVSTRFTITWFHSEKCYVYIQDGVGYRIFHDSATARQILDGKVALRPLDSYSRGRLESLHALTRLYVENATRMHAFVQAYITEFKKTRPSVVLNYYKRPYTLIKGYNTATRHRCYVVLDHVYYFYYELTSHGTAPELLYDKTAHGLLQKILTGRRNRHPA